jgi:NitT/TauT family transport system ATP-binding protein
VFLITHSIPEAVYLSSRVFVMSSRPGRMVRELEIELPEERPLDIMASARFGAYVGELRHALDHPEQASETPAMSRVPAAAPVLKVA